MTDLSAHRHERFELRHLRLPATLVRRCDELGIRQVRDLESHRDLLAALVSKDRALLEREVERFRAVRLPAFGGMSLDRPLADLVTDHGARSTLARAGIESVGSYLACGRRELLALPGFGPRSLAKVNSAFRAHVMTASMQRAAEWLPDALRQLSLAQLPIDEPARAALDATGARTVGDLLSGVGPDDHQLRGAVRSGLERVLGVTAAPETNSETFTGMLGQLRSSLDLQDRSSFDALLGVGRRASHAPHAEALLTLPLPEAEHRVAAIRRALQASTHPLLLRLADDAAADLAAHEGVLGVEDVTFGTALWKATRTAPDPDLPLRVLALCHDDRWCYQADRLCNAPPDRFRAVVRAVRHALSRARPPARISDLARDPEVADVLPAPGILMHVLRRVLVLSVSLHPVHGEVVSRRRASVATRLEALLEDSDQPLSADDLLFRYRDRHTKGSRRRIQEALRTNASFLQVGGELWSLRARHVDELELLRPEAERRTEEVRATGRRMSVIDAVRRGEISERSAYLLIDLLRRDPSLRDLGRGEFLPRHQATSTLVRELVEDMRRAMGEVPFARFLQNQPESRRRLVARLLRCNRLFVAPAADRIDLLENYPFSEDRLAMLLREVALCAEDGGGYAPLRRVREAVDLAELGGAFLTDHLLLDILRRHGQFELLPDAWIAAPGFGLVRWIQKTTRDILKTHVAGLTRDQIVSQRPDLAEFAACLAELIDQDPLVHTADGLHYQLV